MDVLCLGEEFVYERIADEKADFQLPMYCLKTNSDGLFRYPALKIVKCGVSESSKNLF